MKAALVLASLLSVTAWADQTSHFSVSKYLEPIVAGQNRSKLPDHLTFQPTPMSTDNLRSLLQAHTWQVSYACSGRPISLDKEDQARFFTGYHHTPIAGMSFEPSKMKRMSLGSYDGSVSMDYPWIENYQLTAVNQQDFMLKLESSTSRLRPAIALEANESVIEIQDEGRNPEVCPAGAELEVIFSIADLDRLITAMPSFR